MKKIVALLLAFVLMLGIAACGASAPAGEGGGETGGASANGGFRVGYGKEDITPDGQVAMGGYGRVESRLSTGVLSYLYVTCIAVTDADDNTILIYGMDMCGCSDAVKLIPKISKEAGVPEGNIMVSASHTHSAPSLTTPTSGSAAAMKKFEAGMINAAVAAMEDRKPAKMYGGSIDTEGMNFVRHYVCNDGSYCGDNFGDSSSGYAGHASQADPQLQLIKFTREGDKDIYLTNFQTHPHQTGGSTKYDLSADIVGEYRIAMEKALDCEVVYLSGAGGNINSRSRIAEENATADWRAWGVKMAEYAQQVEFTELATGKVQAAELEFTAEINHTTDNLVPICSSLSKQWNASEITTAQLKEMGLAQGVKLNSPYHASAIVSRASMPPSKSFPIRAFSFGDVGLVAFPGEQFDTNGKFIKENSPFKMTIVATKANGENGYFPSAFAFDVSGGYECDTTKYIRGTAERLADTYVEMLTEQFNNK